MSRVPQSQEELDTPFGGSEAETKPAPRRRVTRPRAKAKPHPVDGDMRKDVVFMADGKPAATHDKKFDLLYLTPEDASIWREWGAVKAKRADGYRIPFDEAGEGDYKQGGLTLYKVPKATKAARDAHARNEVAETMRQIRQQAKGSAGGEFVETYETV